MVWEYLQAQVVFLDQIMEGCSTTPVTVLCEPKKSKRSRNTANGVISNFHLHLKKSLRFTEKRAGLGLD